MSDYVYILAKYAICDRGKSRNFAAKKGEKIIILKFSVIKF